MNVFAATLVTCEPQRICHEITRDFVVMSAVVQDNYKNTDTLLYNVSMFVCGMCIYLWLRKS